MKTNFSHRVLVAALFALVSSAVLASNPPPIPTPITGTPAFGSYAGGPFDTVNLANLNVHFTIPIYGKNGAGGGFYYALSYDSLIWVPDNGAWTPMSNWGWRANTEIATGYFTYDEYPVGCGQGEIQVLDHFVYHDPAGDAHPYDPNTIDNSCDGGFIGSTLTTDGSGYTIKSFRYFEGTLVADIYDRSGDLIAAPAVLTLQAGIGAGSITDPKGNYRQTLDGSNFQDSTGAVVLKASGPPPTYPNCSSSPVTFKYQAPNNNNWVSVTVSYVYYEVQTNFGAGISEYTPHPVCLVNQITLPDGSHYNFTYETTVGNGISGKTTGRIASVTLPTGGVISYSYAGTGCGNNSNSMMADGSPCYMTKTLSGGQYIGGGPWTYSRQLNPAGGGNPQLTQTTVLDPASSANETDLSFSGIYEQQRFAYQGHGSSKVLLQETHSCYNNYTNCPSQLVTLPIRYKVFFDDKNQQGPFAAYEYWYNTYGLTTQEKDHDFTTDNPVIRIVNTSYDTALCSGSNDICDRRDYVQITDAAGNQKALTNYTYDSKGNTTEISQWVSGSPYLNQYYSYNANGTVKTATDPNGTVTNYYAGGYACTGAFPNSVSVPGDGGNTLTTSYTYNCTGGVVTSVIDPNGATTSASYTDPDFWRPASTTEPTGKVTYYNYYGVNNSGSSAVTIPDQTESVLSWTSSQGNSTIDYLSTPDGYGRPLLQQQRQGPGSGNWDTAEYYYTPSNQVWYIGYPFSAVAGPGGAKSNGGIPAIGYWYDALGRTTAVFQCNGADCDGAKTSYAYNANDVAITGGSFSGGQTFGKQLEYDALGRLTSICELSPHNLSGVGACNQNTNPGSNGYKSIYTYDPLGDLLSVNQSGQTRAFTYDSAGRMLSEANPENGTTHYTYDTDGTCGTHSGDEVKRVDAANNVTCYTWDGLHRLTNVTYESGPNQANSTNKEYQYDVSDPDGYVTVGYPKGRLVESHTSTSQGWAGTELFGYDARGDATDAWYWIPDGQGWYHTVNSYAPSGAVWGRMGYLGLGTTTPFTNGLAYVVDGEGQLNGLWDHNLSQSIWCCTTYSPAGQPDHVVFYNGDSESFLWGDLYSGQMTQWKSTVGSQTQTGNLTWSANGTLNQLAITDTADSGNTQSCTNTYDDLARLSQNFCQGTPGWSQTFTYDAFGNIKKTGSATFTPTYASNNRISGSGFTYDGMGNVTDDGANTYSYDAEGRPSQVNGAKIFIDGFNRIVEVQSPGAWREYVYAPDGYKLGLMNGQSVVQVFAPLAMGMQAVYGPYTNGASQLLFWQHSDWLGSERLASTPAHTVYFDGAYAPYAENYAGIGTSDRSFTGQNMDTVYGIYDFPMRQYSQTQGRWNVPDPAGVGAVDITNPQTWNRYAYVVNNPLSNVDPLGLYCDIEDAIACEDGYGTEGDDNGGDDPCAYDACVVAPPPPDVQPEEIPPNDDDLDYPQYTFYAQGTAKFPGVPTIPSTISGTISGIVNPSLKTSFFLSLPPGFGLNYCGPGANGKPPSDRTDTICMHHDDCDQKSGISSRNFGGIGLTPAQKAAENVCNANLCAEIIVNAMTLSFTFQEAKEAFFVGQTFGCFDPYNLAK